MPTIDLDDVVNVIGEKPFTFLLLFLGAVFGYFFPGGLDYFLQINMTAVVSNPNALAGYIFGFPIAIFIEVISTLLCGLVGALIGLLIDSLREHNL